MIILIAIPLLLRAVGIFCEKRDSRTLMCAATASAVFIICELPAVTGIRDCLGGSIVTDIINTPFDMLSELEAPPAEVLLMKLCSFFGDCETTYPMVMAGITALLAGYAVKDAPYHGSAVLCFMFVPALLFAGDTFRAALICTTASVYIRERRFFRYAAIVLVAACFDMSALLTLPFYFVTLIPGAVGPAVIAVAAAVLAGVFPGILDGVFDTISGRTVLCGTPVLWAVIAVIAAAVCTLMYAMFRNREGKYERLIPTMCCGAALTAAAIFDTGLYAPAIMLLTQAAVPLADETYSISSKFVGIVFKEKEKAARNIFLAVCVAAEAGLCALLVFTDAFGMSAFYDAAVKSAFGS